jgi:signal transduction histidine kinase
VNLNEVILEVVALSQPASRRSGISLHTELADALPRIVGDRVQLQQVVLNLVMNAIESIKAGGEMPRDVSIASAPDDDNRIVVAVRDSGSGLDEANLDRIFEGFFTTKPEGLGMGLTICRSIVEAHGGRISAATAAPRGAIVRFTLPVVRSGAP